MSIFINKASVAGGKVRITASTPGNELNALQSLRYASNSDLYISTVAPIATDQWTQGFRFKPDGALITHPFESLGAPASIQYRDGMATTQDGALITTTTAQTRHLLGWPIAGNGYVCV